ncbi:MAG TPA: hypothetical protein VFB50_05425 [Chloroflexota bacterium]|nr:hypothetical protein [Chloroflexota bacterium]
MPSNADLIRRAHAAWLRSGPGGPEPVWSASTVEVHKGRTYVVLRRGGETVAIYRYKPATAFTRDTLKLLKRMPTHEGGYAHAAA